MGSWPVKLGRKIFNLLSSLKLAVILLSSLAIVLAVGTIFESLHDTETAQYFVYQTWWFIGLLVLLGLNVLFAALSRYPWKKHHIGFLVVHLGIIIILIGSLISLMKGYEGQLILAEGEQRDRIFLKESRLYFFDQSNGQLEDVSADFRFNPPSLDRPYRAQVFGDIQIEVDQYLANAQPVEKISNTASEINPAIQIDLSGSRAQMKEWVFSRDFSRQQLSLGPATVTFLEIPQLANLDQLTKNPQLRGPVLSMDGQLFPVAGQLGHEFKVGTAKIFIRNFVPHAAVHQGVLVNLSDQPENPVLKLTLTTSQGSQDHTVFAKYPEMPTVHGPGKPNSPKLNLLWIPKSLNDKDNELIVARLSNGKLFYRLKKRGVWQDIRPLVKAQAIPTGWMDFKFSLADSLTRARVEQDFRRVPVPKGKQGPPPALHLRLTQGSTLRELWLGRGEATDLQLGKYPLKIAFALKSVPLGFQVKLKDFRMGKYQGTENPSSYESLVTVLDPAQGYQQDHLIAMNEPLVYGKYKTFQASYQINPEGPDWSVLAVAYDPGIFLKYLGSIILVLGIILIFFFRPAFLKKNAKKKVLKKTALPSDASSSWPYSQFPPKEAAP